MQTFLVQGDAGKGCAKVDGMFAPTDTGMHVFSERPDAQFFKTLYSFGDFYIDAIQRPLSMRQNQTLPDSGVELRDDPANDYPRTQFWSMYSIFTIDLAALTDSRFRIFQVANRRDLLRTVASWKGTTERSPH
jgi:hypothetical protein